MNVAEALCQQAALSPNAPAIVDRVRRLDRHVTFAELEQSSCRVAGLLREAGLVAGDGILILLPMSAELYTAIAAICRLGLVAIFLDPSSGREHIERCCILYPPAALIASAKAQMLCLASPALRRIPRKLVVGVPIPGTIPWARAETLPLYEAMEASTPDTPALLTFTSGSGGEPKAALRTHGFLMAQHRAIEQMTAPTSGEMDLAALPIVALSNLSSGVASLIPAADLRRPDAIQTRPVLAQIQAHRPTRITASPALLERLTDDALLQGLSFPILRAIFTGGGPVFPRLLDKLQRVAPEARIVAVYGSTEAEPIAYYSRQAGEECDMSDRSGERGLLAGLPAPTLRLRIMPDRWGWAIGPCAAGDFEAGCVPPEAIGEIVVCGEHVLPGYLHGAGDIQTRIQVDGEVWLRTGDAGYLDGRGQLWLLGRCDARIEDARGTLYPLAVECAAQQLPCVRRAAVLSHRGQRVLAVAGFGRIPPEEIASLRRSLDWAGIDSVRVFRELPMDRRHNAKVDYPALRRLLESSVKGS